MPQAAHTHPAVLGIVPRVFSGYNTDMLKILMAALTAFVIVLLLGPLVIPMLARLKETVINNGNVFADLIDAVRVCSLGQITTALYDVGGQYRRSM